MSITFNGNVQLIGKQPLSVTENGTYNAPNGKAYDPVTVNVSGGGGQAEEQLKGLIDGSATHIDIPSGVTSIKAYAFYGMTELASVTIPASVSAIEGHAFYNCQELNNVVLPSGLTEIPTFAFAYCYELDNITIPDSVKKIGASAFAWCKFANITIPSQVQYIYANAFDECTNLRSVSLPNSMTYIGNNAFKDCSALTTITCDFASGAVSGAPWGAPSTTQIIYLR